MTALDILHTWATNSDVEIDVVNDHHAVVVLPGEKKLKTAVSVKESHHSLDCQAFIIRRPDENHLTFATYLLRKNLELSMTAFAVDHLGDVYLRAAIPREAVTEDLIDRLMGEFLTVADSSFNELLVRGFITSMKKEWEWRVSRGESTRNLEAFRKILDPDAQKSDTRMSE
ncbi:hypothetical protein HMPREF0183_0183 [Brevibacterium mcbrellneri ATCC 49030]|uniref:YbjN domain-containing protein n=1 Tax=Brevibacterium mcbrellneri ATCC 49030 TaxID=585530 RepID=D4YJS3_9MICO|nr:YbjN domain-containing protein [Brevibacterium mcbrellneri]EFG48493.1 hypothetical protein HMPREF0183_0183 [Brevibacterium mcbrellneri ATCC 49030]